MGREIDIVVVDRDRMLRENFEGHATTWPCTVTSVRVFEHADALADAYPQLPPTGVLFLDDEDRRITNVLDTIHETANHTHMHTVVVSTQLAAMRIRQIIESPAQGYIYRFDDLLESMRYAAMIVSEAMLFLSPSVTRVHEDARGWEVKLRDVDLQVLELMAVGLTPNQIGARLNVSPRTIYRVHNHLVTVFGVNGPEQILDSARQCGLLDA